MKKLVTAFAACMIAGLVSAQVTSQNIVGYKMEARTGGAWIQSVQFQQVGSTNNASFALKDVLDYSTIAQDDQLWVFDVTLGDYIQYSFNGTDWVTLDGNNTVTQITTKVGASYLLITANTLCYSGEVPSLTTYTHTLNGDGAYLIGSAFPANRTLANFNWAATLSQDDQLWLFDVDLGDYHQYSLNGSGSWISLEDNVTVLPTTTTLNDGFLLITGAASLQETL